MSRHPRQISIVPRSPARSMASTKAIHVSDFGNNVCAVGRWKNLWMTSHIGILSITQPLFWESETVRLKATTYVQICLYAAQIQIVGVSVLAIDAYLPPDGKR